MAALAFPASKVTLPVLSKQALTVVLFSFYLLKKEGLADAPAVGFFFIDKSSSSVSNEVPLCLKFAVCFPALDWLPML